MGSPCLLGNAAHDNPSLLREPTDRIPVPPRFSARVLCSHSRTRIRKLYNGMNRQSLMGIGVFLEVLSPAGCKRVVAAKTTDNP